MGIANSDLVNDIVVTHKVHPTTGILGWKFMLEALTTNQRSDIGVQLNQQTTYPSIGYMIQGPGNPEPATTVWELWDSDVEGPGMNSRNHIMFGSVGAWLYKSFLGLVPAPANATLGQAAGFDHFYVGPDASVVNAFNMTSASGGTTTPRGVVQVSWAVGSTTSCGSGVEGDTVSFSCGGSAIKGFTFLSYGTPTGKLFFPPTRD